MSVRWAPRAHVHRAKEDGSFATDGWARGAHPTRLIAGNAKDWPALNSFFDDRSTEPRQSAEVRARLAKLKPGETFLLVTHQVNIIGLTGIVPAMGEAVFVRVSKRGDKAIEVVGRLAAGG